MRRFFAKSRLTDGIAAAWRMFGTSGRCSPPAADPHTRHRIGRLMEIEAGTTDDADAAASVFPLRRRRLCCEPRGIRSGSAAATAKSRLAAGAVRPTHLRPYLRTATPPARKNLRNPQNRREPTAVNSLSTAVPARRGARSSIKRHTPAGIPCVPLAGGTCDPPRAELPIGNCSTTPRTTRRPVRRPPRGPDQPEFPEAPPAEPGAENGEGPVRTSGMTNISATRWTPARRSGLVPIDCRRQYTTQTKTARSCSRTSFRSSAKPPPELQPKNGNDTRSSRGNRSPAPDTASFTTQIDPVCWPLQQRPCSHGGFLPGQNCSWKNNSDQGTPFAAQTTFNAPPEHRTQRHHVNKMSERARWTATNCRTVLWAMRDSNPRLHPCKGCTLAN